MLVTGASRGIGASIATLAGAAGYSVGVNYLKNGSVLYTSSQMPIYPLVFDAAIYNPHATIAGARIGTSTPPSPGPKASPAPIYSAWPTVAGEA